MARPAGFEPATLGLEGPGYSRPSVFDQRFSRPSVPHLSRSWPFGVARPGSICKNLQDPTRPPYPSRHHVLTKDTPLTNLYVTILDKLGVPIERLGDSTGPLEGLSV